jgi:flagellar basal-body rod protein FlgG
MDAGIFSAVSGSLAAQTRLDALANNLANASTAGFKAERVLQRAERAGEIAPPLTAVPTVTRETVVTDFSQGRSTRAAIPRRGAGRRGFLVVRTGAASASRNGSLGIDGGDFSRRATGNACRARAATSAFRSRW